MKAIINMSKKVFLSILLLTTLLCVTSEGTIIYVDDDAVGANNGTSWSDAYNYLQDALAEAASAAKPVEIRVAQGIYKPDQGESETAGDQTATFQLINGVGIKGGYSGVDDTRDIVAYETVLSGDLEGNDGPDFTNMLENSVRVTQGNGTDSTAILDGLTITAGYEGGGMQNINGSPIIVNCKFTLNAGGSGAGMCNFTNSNPQVTNCTFENNRGIGGYSDGGGMSNGGSNPTITNCTFTNNSVELRGGGLSNSQGSSPILTNCTFTGNSNTAVTSNCYGGGVYNQGGNAVFNSCIFNKNTSTYIGGGVYNGWWANTKFENCTFSENSAYNRGGGIHNGLLDNNSTFSACTFTMNRVTQSHSLGGGMFNERSSPILTNCTFSGNSADNSNSGGGGMYNGSDSNPTLASCNFSVNSAVSGGGLGNDNASPILTGCTFEKNSAVYGGGGMWNRSSSPTLTNCTFENNEAVYEGAGMENKTSSSPILTNCVFTK